MVNDCVEQKMEFYMREVVLRLIIPNNWIKEISPNYNFSIKCIECMTVERGSLK
jgi:hypothetical protein